MGLEVRWARTGHEIRFQRLSPIHFSQFQHSFVAAFAFQSKADTMASIVTNTTETASFFEFFIRITNHRLLCVFRLYAFGHELMTAYVVTAEKLLNAPKKATFLLSYVMFHSFVAAWIIVA